MILTPPLTQEHQPLQDKPGQERADQTQRQGDASPGGPKGGAFLDSDAAPPQSHRPQHCPHRSGRHQAWGTSPRRGRPAPRHAHPRHQALHPALGWAPRGRDPALDRRRRRTGSAPGSLLLPPNYSMLCVMCDCLTACPIPWRPASDGILLAHGARPTWQHRRGEETPVLRRCGRDPRSHPRGPETGHPIAAEEEIGAGPTARQQNHANAVTKSLARRIPQGEEDVHSVSFDNLDVVFTIGTKTCVAMPSVCASEHRSSRVY